MKNQSSTSSPLVYLLDSSELLERLGLERVAPRYNELRFADWWRKTSQKIEKTRKKGFNCVVILGAWTLWIQSNKCVFDGASPLRDAQ
jgi:hypothetical protein